MAESPRSWISRRLYGPGFPDAARSGTVTASAGLRRDCLCVPDFANQFASTGSRLDVLLEPDCSEQVEQSGEQIEAKPVEN